MSWYRDQCYPLRNEGRFSNGGSNGSNTITIQDDSAANERRKQEQEEKARARKEEQENKQKKLKEEQEEKEKQRQRLREEEEKKERKRKEDEENKRKQKMREKQKEEGKKEEMERERCRKEDDRYSQRVKEKLDEYLANNEKEQSRRRKQQENENKRNGNESTGTRPKTNQSSHSGTGNMCRPTEKEMKKERERKEKIREEKAHDDRMIALINQFDGNDDDDSDESPMNEMLDSKKKELRKNIMESKLSKQDILDIAIKNDIPLGAAITDEEKFKRLDRGRFANLVSHQIDDIHQLQSIVDEVEKGNELDALKTQLDKELKNALDSKTEKTTVKEFADKHGIDITDGETERLSTDQLKTKILNQVQENPSQELLNKLSTVKVITPKLMPRENRSSPPYTKQMINKERVFSPKRPPDVDANRDRNVKAKRDKPELLAYARVNNLDIPNADKLNADQLARKIKALEGSSLASSMSNLPSTSNSARKNAENESSAPGVPYQSRNRNKSGEKVLSKVSDDVHVKYDAEDYLDLMKENKVPKNVPDLVPVEIREDPLALNVRNLDEVFEKKKEVLSKKPLTLSPSEYKSLTTSQAEIVNQRQINEQQSQNMKELGSLRKKVYEEKEKIELEKKQALRDRYVIKK